MTESKPLRTGAINAGREYRELPAWQKGIAMAEAIYAATEAFPEREHAGLALQMRQSAIKVPGHIAAASARLNDHGMSDSYSHSQSAAAELVTQAELAQKLGFLNNAEELGAQLEEIERLLIGMKHGLKVKAKDDERKERETGKLDREHRERNERSDRKPRRDFDKPRGDRDRGGDRERGADREERQYKPRGEYKPRDGEYKPRRDFKDKPRDGEYKPKRDYGDKPRGERSERGEYKPKRDYGDKPRGERSERGEYKPKRDYGDKPRGGDRDGGYKPKRDFKDKPRGGGGRPYRKD